MPWQIGLVVDGSNFATQWGKYFGPLPWQTCAKGSICHENFCRGPQKEIHQKLHYYLKPKVTLNPLGASGPFGT